MDVYQSPDEIVVEAMIAGVKPEDLDVSITRDMVTIKGKREESREVAENDYFYKELYWGSFSRTILLPQEIEPEEAQAVEKHGLLTFIFRKWTRKKWRSSRCAQINPQNKTRHMAGFVLWCLDPDSNWGPFPLQGNALPTELSKRIYKTKLLYCYVISGTKDN